MGAHLRPVDRELWQGDRRVRVAPTLQRTGGRLTNTLTIAHISDLHLSPEHRRKNIRSTKRLLEAIGALGVDHLVITGDLAANAEKRDFQLARAILRSSGWLDSSRLSVVIGNHDVFGGVHHAEDILTFPKHCKHTDYKRMVAQFQEHFHEAFQRCLFASESSLFPFAKVVGDVVFIGMNSVAEYSKLGNPIGSNGNVHEGELKRVKKLLSSDLLERKRKVVMIHHHFSKPPQDDSGTMQSIWNAVERQTMKLRRKKEIVNVLKEAGVELVLHGHLHENSEYVRNGIRFLNGGGSVLGNPDVPRINVLRVDAAGIQIDQLVLDGSGISSRVLSQNHAVTHFAA